MTKANSASIYGFREEPTFTRTDEYVRPIEEETQKTAGGTNCFYNCQCRQAQIFMSALHRSRRRKVIAAGTNAGSPRLSVQRFLAPESASPAAPICPAVPLQAADEEAAAEPRSVADSGTGHRNSCRLILTELLAKVRTIPGIVDADTNFEATAPELRVRVDRTRAADLGVSIDSLASSLRLLVGGDEVSKYKEGDDQFSVKLRLDEQFRNNPATNGRVARARSGRPASQGERCRQSRA